MSLILAASENSGAARENEQNARILSCELGERQIKSNSSKKFVYGPGTHLIGCGIWR